MCMVLWGQPTVKPFAGAPVASLQPSGVGSHLLHVTSKMQHVGQSFLLPCFFLSPLPCLLFLFASSFFLPGPGVGQEWIDGDLMDCLACSTQLVLLCACAPQDHPKPPSPGGTLTAMRAWRSFSLSLRIRCCSALSARRCSCRRRGRWLGQPNLQPPCP